jgi:hypothetical protein
LLEFRQRRPLWKNFRALLLKPSFLGPKTTERFPVCSTSAEEILGEIQPLQENDAGTSVEAIDGVEIKIIPPKDAIASTIGNHNLFPLEYTREIYTFK